MKYKIIYYYNGGHSLSSRIIEAKNEKEALARLQGVYGHNPRYEIKRIIPQNGAESSAHFDNQESTLEAEDKLTAYKVRQKLKEQKPIWFYAVDGDNIEGPVVMASIENKIDNGILKEDSLVMKTDDDWITVSEFKELDTPFEAAIPSPSLTQSHNTKPLPVIAAKSSPHSTQMAYKSSPYSSSARAKASTTYPTSVAYEYGFFQKLSSGEFGLAKTYWLYGVVVGFVLSLGIKAITSMGLLTIIILTYAAYQTLVLSGTWRASNKYEGWKVWAALAKVAVVIGAIGLTVSVLMIVGLYAKS